MPLTPHVEHHFTASAIVRDIVIGMADGLTVPFALAAGVSGVIDSTAIVVTAGLAEIAAGAIAMGLGGYLAGKSDLEHYIRERAREELEITQMPEVEAAEVTELLQSHGLTAEESAPVVAALRKRPEAWRDFMMRFELGLQKPDPARARTSGLVIGSAYVAGGLIPLAPYMLMVSARRALPWSVLVTLTALAAFGWVKGHFAGTTPPSPATPSRGTRRCRSRGTPPRRPSRESLAGARRERTRRRRNRWRARRGRRARARGREGTPRAPWRSCRRPRRRPSTSQRAAGSPCAGRAGRAGCRAPREARRRASPGRNGPARAPACRTEARWSRRASGPNAWTRTRRGRACASPESGSRGGRRAQAD